MIPTRALIDALRRANPGAKIEEHQVRAALRWGGLPAPRLFAGRLAWTAAEARALADYLGVELPGELTEEVSAP